MATYDVTLGTMVSGAEPLTVPIPAGTHTGKLMLLYSTRQVVVTPPPATPTGWTYVGNGNATEGGNPHLFAKLWEAAEPDPVIDYPGGLAIGQVMVVGASSGWPAGVIAAINFAQQAANAAATSARYPAQTLTGNGFQMEVSGGGSPIDGSTTNAVGVTAGYTLAGFSISNDSSGRVLAAQYRNAETVAGSKPEHLEAYTPTPTANLIQGGISVEIFPNPEGLQYSAQPQVDQITETGARTRATGIVT